MSLIFCCKKVADSGRSHERRLFWKSIILGWVTSSLIEERLCSRKNAWFKYERYDFMLLTSSWLISLEVSKASSINLKSALSTFFQMLNSPAALNPPMRFYKRVPFETNSCFKVFLTANFKSSFWYTFGRDPLENFCIFSKSCWN